MKLLKLLNPFHKHDWELLEGSGIWYGKYKCKECGKKGTGGFLVGS